MNNNIYLFTTENIAGYIEKLDVENKEVLTVGSSCDQAFNCLLLGANKVTIFDINENIKKYYELKRTLIIDNEREEFIDKTLNVSLPHFEDVFSKNDIINMNLYLKNDDNYKKLQNILQKKKIEIVTGNLFEDLKLKDKYDRVILSNVLQYLDNYSGKRVYEIYKNLEVYLNNDSIVQLFYLYGNLYPKKIGEIINLFIKDNILFEKENCDDKDSVIFVKKRTF